MCLSVSNVKGHTGVNDLKCQSGEPADNVYVCVTVSLHVCLNTQTVCVLIFFFFSPYVCVSVLCVFSPSFLAAESIRLHWRLIVFLLGLRDGLL